MFEFLIGKSTIKGTQKFIDKLEPKINIHVSNDLPLPSVRLMKKMSSRVCEIKKLEEGMSKFSDEELQAKTTEFKKRYHDGIKEKKERLSSLEEEYEKVTTPEQKEDLNIQIEKVREEYRKAKRKTLDDLLPEAFAVVRESGKRILSMRHFDVQMIGGIVLHSGDIAEMTTGEGKTLVATLPAYLNALTGEGVHIITVNDYLASRDKEWMGPIFEFLGLSVGVILHDLDNESRREAYGCDITYGTNNEFGFDYLRDNMVNHKDEMVQRKHYFSVVDEVDSILIDEARTPLIISGPAEESTGKYYTAFDVSKKLKGRRITEKDEIDAKYQEIDLTEGYDYMADEKNKSIAMTDSGEEKAAQLFGIDNLHDMENIEYRHHILQALKAKEFFKLDVDYVVRDGQVLIVDEFTGRLMPGRRWSDGLHQAVEAREGIKIERENQTLATITFQNYFRMYEKLSGMTGTAVTEANEFKQIYNLDVVVIPTNKRLQRKNFPDAIYKTEREKFNAAVEEIRECNDRGQPVLVGTISIERSELLSKLLTQNGIEHKVLNAKYHESEANIIAQAGRYKAVTIATNMAGRGTDIVLGGNAEFLASNLAQQKLDESKDESQKEEVIQKFLDQFKEQCKSEQEKVIAEGGLHVLGTERHEARRIDNQLRGRQGRQGDPGSSRFYVSLQDDLMRLFASDRIAGMMERLGMEEGQVLEHPLLSRALEGAQRRVEGYNFEIRKHLLDYDDVMNRQREVIYDMRRYILESSNVKDMILESIDDAVNSTVMAHLYTEGNDATFDVEGLSVYLKATFDYELVADDDFRKLGQDGIVDLINEGISKKYKDKERQIGVDRLRQMEKMLLMHTIDSKWKDHLYAMDQLKEGIGLRSFAQRDPLIEYKKEGFAMFEGMYNSIHMEVSEIIFKIQPADESKRRASPRGVFSSIPQNLVHDEISGLSDVAKQSAPRRNQSSGLAPRDDGDAVRSKPIQKNVPKVGRNEPCPCGSGKKYKKCCGR